MRIGPGIRRTVIATASALAVIGGGPYASVLDVYSRNAVVGWWEDGCNGGWTGCRAPTDGQDKFRGALTQGLWEFTKEDLSRPQTFFITPFLKDRCPIREQPCA